MVVQNFAEDFHSTVFLQGSCRHSIHLMCCSYEQQNIRFYDYSDLGICIIISR